MGATDVIGPAATAAVVLSIAVVFGHYFNITMDSYWADYFYSTDPASEKAKKVSRRASNYWTGYGFLIFYVIAGAFNVAAFYTTWYDSYTGTTDMKYTAGVSLFIVLIGLDKGIAPMIHYYSYKNLRYACGFYGFVSWIVVVVTIFVIGFEVNTTAAYLLIPYAAYSTSVNLTCWIMFLFKDDVYTESSGDDNSAAKFMQTNAYKQPSWKASV